MKKIEFPFSIYFYGFLAYYSPFFQKSINLKKYRNVLSYMKDDCSSALDKYRNMDVTLSHPIPKQLWVLWWQGKDKLPPIVKECITRMESLEGYNLTIVDEQNISDYIDLSDVLPLYKSGELKIQFLSDMIRMRILRKHGGFWLDSTLLIMDKNFLDKIVEKYSFYSIRLKDFEEWRNVSAARWSAYFWATCPDNPFFAYMDDVLKYFALKHKTILDYFQIDFTVRLGYEELPWVRNLIDSFPYYDYDMFYLDNVVSNEITEDGKALIDDAPMFKLNWRRELKTLEGKTTSFEYAMKRLGFRD